MKMPFKKNAAAGAIAKAGARKSASSLAKMMTGVMMAIIVVFALLAFILHRQFSDQAQTIQVQQLESVASSIAGQIQETVRHLHASMELTVKDPQLVQDLASGNAGAIAQRENSLNFYFPAAIRVKLLPTGIDQPDNSMSPPLGFACIDQVHAAEGNKNPPAEVHLYGQPQQHIDLVRAVQGGRGQVIGSLLVSLPVSAIQEALDRVKLQGGYVQLLQTSSVGSTVFASRGDSSRKSAGGQDAKRIPIEGTRWVLLYWPPKVAGFFEGRGALVYWGGFVAGGLILLLAAWFVLLKIKAALQRDQVTIIRLFKDIRDSQVQQNYPVALIEQEGLIGQLQLMARDLTGRKGRSGPVDGAPGTAPMTEYNDAPPVATTEPEAVSEAPPAAPVTPQTPEPTAFAEQDVIDNSALDALGPQEDVLDIKEEPMPEAVAPTQVSNINMPENIFRAYDIRGVVGDTLDAEIVRMIGTAIGSEAQDRGLPKIVVARDGRLSGPELSQALIEGLKESGREVIDIGRVPTPVLYFATHYVGNGSGVMLTGSHNPPDYNGMKIMLGGETLHGDTISALRTRILEGRLYNEEGSVQNLDVVPSYIERITADVRMVRPMKVVIDCGNGVAGEVAPQLFRTLGCEVIELFCDVDGTFPNHHPDPSKPENLLDLTRTVAENAADLGVAFDGDGDRLGVVDSGGKIIWPDRYLMLMAKDVLMRQPGAKIIYDVKCTRHLDSVIRENGGDPLMWKTGHSFIKAKMQETNAQLAGEMSGHVFFKERWFGFDDGLYAAARLLEIMSGESSSTNRVFAALPDSVTTPEITVTVGEGENFTLMEQLVANAQFPGAKIITIDGLRVEYEDGWGLVRASNTTPSLVIRFEADSAEALQRIQESVREQLQGIAPKLSLPF